MGKRYLIDTNILVYYFAKVFDAGQEQVVKEVMKHHFGISVITEIEFLGFPGFKDDPIQFKNARHFLDQAYLYPLTPTIITQTIEIKQHYKIKTPDAIIASTALVHDLILVSRNTNDFIMLPDLELLNPFTL